MSGYYKGKVKVIGPGLMCFPADPETLEPLACSTYDRWAISDPDTDPVRTMSAGEWNLWHAEKRAREMLDWYVKRANARG